VLAGCLGGMMSEWVKVSSLESVGRGGAQLARDKRTTRDKTHSRSIDPSNLSDSKPLQSHAHLEQPPFLASNPLMRHHHCHALHQPERLATPLYIPGKGVYHSVAEEGDVGEELPLSAFPPSAANPRIRRQELKLKAGGSGVERRRANG
jgi:hypothetical protein